MKSYTDLEQSKKLAEILPLESADMCYLKREFNDTFIETPIVKPIGGVEKSLCCWSLAALLGVLPPIEGFCPIIDLDINLIRYEGNYRDELCFNGNNLVDVCYELILKLNELKML